MARRKSSLTRKRIGVIAVGIIVVAFLGNVILTGGQSLNLANPFAGGLDFRQTELKYSMFSLLDVQKLNGVVIGTEQELLNKKCYLKLHTSAQLDTGTIIPLDSPFQTFGALTPFNLLTQQGQKIFEFRQIELRLRCDPIYKKDAPDTPIEFEIIPRASNPLYISTWGFNQAGKLIELKGIDLKPAFEFGGIAYTFNSQVEFLVNPSGSQLNQYGTLKFINDPNAVDPLKGTTGIYATSERTISKSVRIKASDLEFAIEDSVCTIDRLTGQPIPQFNCALPPKTFTSELQFRIHGAFDINYPELRDAGILQRQIPVDQGLLQNKMDIQISEFTSNGISLLPSDKTQITKLEPVDKDGDFVIDGTAEPKTLRVYATLDNYDRNEEGSVKGTIINPHKNIIATTGLGCGFPVSTSGGQSNFICNFNILQNTPVGEDYIITIDTAGVDRIATSKTFKIILQGSPVGVSGCPDKYVHSSILGICVLYGTSGTGGLPFTGCPLGQFRDPNTNECIVGTGGTGADPCTDNVDNDGDGVIDERDECINPCPKAGEVRDSIGNCVPTKGTGGVGTVSCYDCEMNIIRTINKGDLCPKFTKEDCGGVEPPPREGIENCPDKKPADILPDGSTTCIRAVGFLGGLLPILVDCEGEGRDADPAQGEICAPAWLIGIFENLPLLIGIVIFLIIFIVIIVAILKRSPAGIAYGAVRGALPKR